MGLFDDIVNEINETEESGSSKETEQQGKPGSDGKKKAIHYSDEFNDFCSSGKVDVSKK